MLTSNELPTEVARSVPLKVPDDGSLKKKNKNRGSLSSDLKFAYQWSEGEGHLVGFDTANGTSIGEYSFGDVGKDTASIEAVVEFVIDGTKLACCAVSYENRCLLCCVDLSLTKVVHSIKIKKYPLTSLKVIWHGSQYLKTSKVHPILRNAGGLLAAGQIGGKVLLIDMQTDYANWWKHEEFNPTSLNMVGGESCGDPAVLQKAESLVQKGLHLAVVLDGGHDESLEITCMQYCKEPNILIVGHNTGHFDIWSLTTLARIYAGEPTGGRISHIMSMLPEDDPRKSIYIWVVENGRPEDSIVDDHNICASANLHVIAYKSSENVANDYEDLESVNCMFRLLFDKVGDSNETDTYTTTCVSVSPISIDINNHYLSSLNCTGLCSFVWSEQNLSPRKNLKFYSTIFDLGRWYAEEMPKQALVSELEIIPKSYLAYAHLETGRSELLEAQVCSSGTKKNVWELNEEVTSFAAATSFSMLLVTNKNILEVYFPGIQSYLFDKIDELKPWELIEPHNLFTKCIVAGLMPEGMYSAKKIYPKVKMVEAIYEVAINHNLLAFMRRCASEFFDGKYESDGLSTQHLFEWAWNKAVEIKAKIDDLLNSMYAGQEMTQSDKNSHSQYTSDLKCITKLFTHVEKEQLLHSEESRQGLQQRMKGLALVNDYLQCVQYFCTCRLIPNAASSGLSRLDLLKNDYAMRRQKDGELLVDLLVNRFGNELKELWISLGGDGMYPPPSMHSMLIIFLLDAAHVKDKHCLMLYFLNDITNTSRMNGSLAAGYKEMISSPECNDQELMAKFLWTVDRGYLMEALKCLGNDKLDPSWTETIFAHLNLRSSSKELYEVYRCIGLDTDTIDRKKFVISLFLDIGLVVPAFKWIRSVNAGIFDSTCFAFFLTKTHEMNGLDKLVAKELSLNPPELSMLYNYLKRHGLSCLVTQLEEKIGMSNFVPFEADEGKIYEDILDFTLPEVNKQYCVKSIESVEVQKFLRGSFTSMKQMFCTPLTNRILPEPSKPSILKTTDSPAASPHMSPAGASPSLKRLRFQLPKRVNVSSVSSSSNESSPVKEDLTIFEFQTPHQASTPKTTPVASPEPDSVFAFSVPSPVLHRLKQIEGESSPLSKSSLSSVGDVMDPSFNFVAEIGEHNTSTPVESEVAEKEDSLYFETEDPAKKDTLIGSDDSFDYGTVTPVIQRVAPFVNTEQRKRRFTELAANILNVPAIRIADCEDDVTKVSPSSHSNDSFFSVCSEKTSPNSSMASYTSALDATITLSEEEDVCPITKRRRSEVFDKEELTPAKTDCDMSEDLVERDFSPSKFWQPPALAPMGPSSGPSACDSIDFSSLPKPPKRPSPRKAIRRSLLDEEQVESASPPHLSFCPQTPEKQSISETQGKLSIPEIPEKSEPSEIIQEVSTSNALDPEIMSEGNGKKEVAEAINEPVADKDKLYDSVFHRTVDITLERDMLELMAERNPKPAADLVEPDVESENDITLNKTVILVSSDSGEESPSITSKLEVEQVSPNKQLKPALGCTSPSKIVPSLSTIKETIEIKTEQESYEVFEAIEESEGPLTDAENAQSEVQPTNEQVPVEIDTTQTLPAAIVGKVGIEAEVLIETPAETAPVLSTESQGMLLLEASSMTHGKTPSPKSSPESSLEKATKHQNDPATVEEEKEEKEEAKPEIIEPRRTRGRTPSQKQPVLQESVHSVEELPAVEETSIEETPKKEPARTRGRTPSPRQPAKVIEQVKAAPILKSKVLGLKIEEQLGEIAQVEEPEASKEGTKVAKKKAERSKVAPEKEKKATKDRKKLLPKSEKEIASKSEERPAAKAVKTKPGPKSVKEKPEGKARAITKMIVPGAEASAKKEAKTSVKKEAKATTATAAKKEVKPPATRNKAATVEVVPEAPVVTRRNLRSASQEPQSLSETTQKSPSKSRAKRKLPETALLEKELKMSPRKREKKDTTPEALSKEPPATSPRRGRSRNFQEEPQGASTRTTRRRSRSANIEPATEGRKTRARSASVSSDASAVSQTSSVSAKKRKADDESDNESTVSESGLRRSTRKRTALQTKRGPKVSMIPEENS